METRLLPALAAVILALLFLVPAAQAGNAAAPDLVDAVGDVQGILPSPVLPCKDAVDLLTFWVEWGSEGLVFHYAFADLSALAEDSPQDATGRCFYSYANFQARIAGSDVEDAVYMDHNSFAAFETGWRFYFHGSGEDLVGVVDLDASTITVTAPYSLIGQPAAGDFIGGFVVQATTNAEGSGLNYEGDFAPDNGEPCDCNVVYAARSDGENSTRGEPTSEPAEESSQQGASASEADLAGTKKTPGGGALLALGLASLALAHRRRD
ncbi:MAG: hypothetical protein AABX89_03735 [Candidatus Thermoplasmatota archaeon]